MTKEEFDQYVKGRYEDQIGWYDRKSGKYKKLYLRFQSVVVVLALAAPVLVALEQDIVWGKWITVVVAALAAIGTAMLKTFKFQETWITYRTTCETLRKEIHYYQWELGEYAVADPRRRMQVFVDRVESLLSQENTKWFSAHSKKDESSTRTGAA